MKYFAGLDWACEAHAICVMDASGSVLDRFEVTHDEAGLSSLTARLGQFAVSGELAVAIERPNGLVVDTLVEAGITVVAIHPNTVKACRTRYSPAHAKSDPGDAYQLADMLRTDGHRFEALKVNTDEMRALRMLVRLRNDLVGERVALGNQLKALLDDYWPGVAGLFHRLDCAISLAFIERYPTPDLLKGLGEKRLGAFLERNGYSGNKAPSVLLEHLRAAPTGLAGQARMRASGLAAQRLVRVLGELNRAIKDMTGDIEQAVGQLPMGRVLMSFPRAGKLNAAAMLVEMGDHPERFASSQALAALAGVAPVTRSSGKRADVAFRRAVNKPLRLAMTTFAGNSRFESAWAADIYNRARARGKRHPHAVRILARAWVGVIWRCWNDGQPYDPQQHRAACNLTAA